MSIKALFPTILASLILSGCIEVRDPEKTPDTQVAQESAPSETLDDLVIDQPMFLIEGKILTVRDIKQIKFDEERELSQEPTTVELKLRKLTFTENGSLQIFSNDLVLEVEEIQSSNGRIYTYPQGTKAGLANNGRDGGRINLLANFASGRLLLEFRGEEGGDGFSADPDPTPLFHRNICRYQRGKRGADGKRGGKSGYIEAIIKNEAKPFELRIQIISAKGGLPEKGVAGKIGFRLPDGSCEAFYNQFSTDGQEGAIGPTGEEETSNIPIRN